MPNYLNFRRRPSWISPEVDFNTYIGLCGPTMRTCLSNCSKIEQSRLIYGDLTTILGAIRYLGRDRKCILMHRRIC